MNRPDTRSAAVHEGLELSLLVAVLVALLSLASVGAGAPQPRPPALSAGDRVSALSSVPVEGGTGADEVRFHRDRLAQRPGDLLSRRRLVAVHLLRFRANGDASELSAAESLVDGLEGRDARDPSVHATRTALALADHRFADAVSASGRALELTATDRADAVLRHFDALWAAGRYVEARALLEADDFPLETPGLLSRQARLLDGLGRVEAARDRMERVVGLVDAFAEPPVIRAWARVELGHFRHHSGDPRGAVDAYLEALDVVPGYPSALEGLGWIAYGVEEDLVTAEALFQRALLFGGHLDLLTVLAEIAEARGAPSRALEYRSRFLDEAARDPGTERRYRRPLAEMLAENPDHAGRAWQLAEADLADRTDRGAWALTAWLLHQAGRHAEAVRHAEKALAWGSPDPSTLARAGEVFLGAGERRRGVRLIRTALEGGSELGPVESARLAALLD